MNSNNYILKLLNFQDKYIEISNINFINGCYHIDLIQLKADNISCPKCGSLSITKNSTYIRTINYNCINNYPCLLKLAQIRFKCNYCKVSFNQPTSIVSKGCNLSNNVKTVIMEESKKKQSFKDVASRTNVSQTTISNEFRKNIHNYRCKLSRVVCIDEFKASTNLGKYALIIGNPLSGDILDILPSRLQDYIYHYFNTIDDSERLNVEFVVTDLFESYRTICKNLFWKSVHIADKFHWVKLTTEAFNKTRISVMNAYLKTNTKQNTLFAATLKRYYKLLLANRYGKESWYFDQPLSQNKLGLTSYQTAIEYCINNDSELDEAYSLLQSLYYISKYSSFENAKKDLLDWCYKVEHSKFHLNEFKRVALTYKSWLNEIANSFIIDPISHKRLSNGFIEGKNNFCKVIKRVGFGYKDFDVFRYKIINCNKNVNK